MENNLRTCQTCQYFKEWLNVHHFTESKCYNCHHQNCYKESVLDNNIEEKTIFDAKSKDDKYFLFAENIPSVH